MRIVSNLCAIGVASLLLYSALPHLDNSFHFLISICAYRMLPFWAALIVAGVLPYLQLVLSISLLFMGRDTRKAGFCYSSILFVCFVVAQVYALSKGLEIACGCFGGSSLRTIGSASVSIATVGLFASLAGYAACRRQSRVLEPIKSRIVDRIASRDDAGRPGFSLIEVVVTIGLVALLMGLIITGVQKTRAAVLRTQCQSHLKQLALAAHQCHDTSSTLPSGFNDLGGNSSRLYSGWQLSLLPYIDQSPAYLNAESDYRTRRLPSGPPPHSGLSLQIALFVCPSDGRIRSPVFVISEQLTVAFTSYLGNCGRDCMNPDGVLYRDSRVGFSSITDGLSNTLIIGERPPGSDLRFGWWYAGYGQRRTGSADMILGVAESNLTPANGCSAGPYEFIESNTRDPCGVYHFWSLHNGGANFAMCDGSVRFVTYGGQRILIALSTAAAGD